MRRSAALLLAARNPPARNSRRRRPARAGRRQSARAGNRGCRAPQQRPHAVVAACPPPRPAGAARTADRGRRARRWCVGRDLPELGDARDRLSLTFMNSMGLHRRTAGPATSPQPARRRTSPARSGLGARGQLGHDLEPDVVAVAGTLGPDCRADHQPHARPPKQPGEETKGLLALLLASFLAGAAAAPPWREPHPWRPRRPRRTLGARHPRPARRPRPARPRPRPSALGATTEADGLFRISSARTPRPA